MHKALEGIRVLDLTRVLSGPYCTMVLADFGADVLKVEVPGTGDDSRGFVPFVNKESAYFMSINRGKRSITLNLKEDKDREIFRELLKKSDVLVENFRPGTMEKLGFGYEDLKKEYPGLIYAAISGFGHTGPYSKLAAYDMIVQAMGGIMSITGLPDGQPVRVGTSIGDITAALFGVIGITLAMIAKKETGIGQKVDVAMLDSQVAILENTIARYMVTHKIPRPMGSRHPAIAPFQSYPTKDGNVIIACGNDNLFKILCKVLEIPQYVDDPRFVSNAARIDNIDLMEEFISRETRKKTTDEIMNLLNEAGVPASPVLTVDQVIANPQVQARDMIVSLKHPTAGDFSMAGNPVKMSETPAIIEMPAPLLGQHTREILREVLGWDDEKIEQYGE